MKKNSKYDENGDSMRDPLYGTWIQRSIQKS